MRIKYLAIPIAAAFTLSATVAMAQNPALGQTNQGPAKAAGGSPGGKSDDKVAVTKKKKGKGKKDAMGAMGSGAEVNKGAGGGATTSSKDSAKPAGK